MAIIWFALSVVLICMEVYLGLTLVLLFSAIASFVVGLTVSLGLISEDQLVLQFSIFFLFTILSYISLWKPMKNFLDKRKSHSPSFSSYVGQEVEVIDAKLIKGEVGLVKWSGTYIRAKISDSASEEVYNIGDKLIVESVIDNIFIVKK